MGYCCGWLKHWCNFPEKTCVYNPWSQLVISVMYGGRRVSLHEIKMVNFSVYFKSTKDLYIYCCRKWFIYVSVFLRLKCLLKGRITTSKTTIIKNVIMLEAQVNISVASILIRWEFLHPLVDVNFEKLIHWLLIIFRNHFMMWWVSKES